MQMTIVSGVMAKDVVVKNAVAMTSIHTDNQYIDVVAFDEDVGRELQKHRKGTPLVVFGRMRVNNYNKEKPTIQLVANSVIFFENPKTKKDEEDKLDQAINDFNEEDLPF